MARSSSLGLWESINEPPTSSGGEDNEGSEEEMDELRSVRSTSVSLKRKGLLPYNLARASPKRRRTEEGSSSSSPNNGANGGTLPSASSTKLSGLRISDSGQSPMATLTGPAPPLSSPSPLPSATSPSIRKPTIPSPSKQRKLKTNARPKPKDVGTSVAGSSKVQEVIEIISDNDSLPVKRRSVARKSTGRGPPSTVHNKPLQSKAKILLPKGPVVIDLLDSSDEAILPSAIRPQSKQAAEASSHCSAGHKPVSSSHTNKQPTKAPNVLPISAPVTPKELPRENGSADRSIPGSLSSITTTADSPGSGTPLDRSKVKRRRVYGWAPAADEMNLDLDDIRHPPTSHSFLEANLTATTTVSKKPPFIDFRNRDQPITTSSQVKNGSMGTLPTKLPQTRKSSDLDMSVLKDALTAPSSTSTPSNTSPTKLPESMKPVPRPLTPSPSKDTFGDLDKSNTILKPKQESFSSPKLNTKQKGPSVTPSQVGATAYVDLTLDSDDESLPLHVPLPTLRPPSPRPPSKPQPTLPKTTLADNGDTVVRPPPVPLPLPTPRSEAVHEAKSSAPSTTVEETGLTKSSPQPLQAATPPPPKDIRTRLVPIPLPLPPPRSVTMPQKPKNILPSSQSSNVEAEGSRPGVVPTRPVPMPLPIRRSVTEDVRPLPSPLPPLQSAAASTDRKENLPSASGPGVVNSPRTSAKPSEPTCSSRVSPMDESTDMGDGDSQMSVDEASSAPSSRSSSSAVPMLYGRTARKSTRGRVTLPGLQVYRSVAPSLSEARQPSPSSSASSEAPSSPQLTALSSAPRPRRRRAIPSVAPSSSQSLIGLSSQGPPTAVQKPSAVANALDADRMLTTSPAHNDQGRRFGAMAVSTVDNSDLDYIDEPSRPQRSPSIPLNEMEMMDVENLLRKDSDDSNPPMLEEDHVDVFVPPPQRSTRTSRANSEDDSDVFPFDAGEDDSSTPSTSPTPPDTAVQVAPKVFGGFPSLNWKSYIQDPKNIQPKFYLSKDLPHTLQDTINSFSDLGKSYYTLAPIMEANIRENTAEDEPDAPLIKIINKVDEDPTPPWEFHYSNKMWLGEGVSLPDVSNLVHCDCVGRCDPKSKTCACAQRQHRALEGLFPTADFLYDNKGRVKATDYPIFECNDLCGCGDECRNRVVQQGRKCAVNIQKTKNKGWGVFAEDKKIYEGTFIGIYAGELLTDAVGDERGVIYNKFGTTYLFNLDFWHLRAGDENWEIKYVVDAYHAGNFTRFLNHSCDPNCGLVPCYINDSDIDKPLLAVFAKRDIEPYEEICFSYFGDPDDEEGGDEKSPASVSGERDAVYMSCACGAARCTGRVFG